MSKNEAVTGSSPFRIGCLWFGSRFRRCRGGLANGNPGLGQDGNREGDEVVYGSRQSRGSIEAVECQRGRDAGRDGRDRRQVIDKEGRRVWTVVIIP